MSKDNIGKCAWCGSENIVYEPLCYDKDGNVLSPLSCLDCGKNSNEVYTVYYERTIKDEE